MAIKRCSGELISVALMKLRVTIVQLASIIVAIDVVSRNYQPGHRRLLAQQAESL